MKIHPHSQQHSQQQKFSPMYLLSGDKVYADIRSVSVIFSVFAGYFFDNFREGQHYYTVSGKKRVYGLLCITLTNLNIFFIIFGSNHPDTSFY